MNPQEAARVVYETAAQEFGGVPLIMVNLSLGGEIVHVSDLGVKMFGYDAAEEMLQKSVEVCVPGILNEESWQTRIMDGQHVSGKRKDGTDFAIQISATIMKLSTMDLAVIIVTEQS